MAAIDNNHHDVRFYLTDLMGARVTWRGKKIGSLADLIIVEGPAGGPAGGNFPEVTKLFVGRPFGDTPLLIPWSFVKVIQEDEVVVAIDEIKKFERSGGTAEIMLKDHILDKKVLDIEGREVEVVYDIKLVLRNGKLLVTDANISKYRLVRRLGLKWFANVLYAARPKEKDKKIPWEFVQPLPTSMSSFRGDVKLKVLKEKLDDIHPADLADIIEELDPDQRLAVFNELPAARASDTLEEIDPSVQRDMVAALNKEKVSDLINKMTPGQAADVLSVLPFDEARDILGRLPPEGARKIKAILEKQEEKAINYTTDKIIRLVPGLTVGQALTEYYSLARGKDIIMYLYIVENGRLNGVADLKELLRASESARLAEVMIPNVVTLSVGSTLKDAYAMFTHYDFRALPVVGKENELLGVVPYRDVMNLKHRFWE